MSSEQLWQTTMTPETRTMMQVSVEDAMPPTSHEPLMGDKVEPRKEFIEETPSWSRTWISDAPLFHQQ